MQLAAPPTTNEPHSNLPSKHVAEEDSPNAAKSIAPESPEKPSETLDKKLEHTEKSTTAPQSPAMTEAGETEANHESNHEAIDVERHLDKTPEVVTPESERGSRKAAGKSAIAPHSQDICSQAVEHNLPIALVAVGWILFSSMIFMSPLSSFSRFINRWFQSDTIAFVTVFLIAAITAVILFWLHVALQILTILAAESLTRIDIQIRGLDGVQAFWILTLISLTGLSIGWLANGVL